MSNRSSFIISSAIADPGSRPFRAVEPTIPPCYPWPHSDREEVKARGGRMAWLGQGWARWALAGLALIVVGIGVLAMLLLARLPEEPDVVYGEAGGKPLLLD